MTFETFSRELADCLFFVPDFDIEDWTEELHDKYVHYRTYYNRSVKEYAGIVFKERTVADFSCCLLEKAILVDTFKGSSHLVAGSIPLLHTFAAKIGLKRHNYENKRGKNQPHYDIKSDFMRRQAIYHGALEISPKGIVTFLKRVYK